MASVAGEGRLSRHLRPWRYRTVVALRVVPEITRWALGSVVAVVLAFSICQSASADTSEAFVAEEPAPDPIPGPALGDGAGWPDRSPDPAIHRSRLSGSTVDPAYFPEPGDAASAHPRDGNHGTAWVASLAAGLFLVWRLRRRSIAKREAATRTQARPVYPASRVSPQFTAPTVDFFHRDSVVAHVSWIAGEHGRANALAYLESRRQMMPWPTYNACRAALGDTTYRGY